MVRAGLQEDRALALAEEERRALAEAARLAAARDRLQAQV